MSNSINISREIQAILKVVQALEKPYGENYLVRLLRGDDAFGWKKPGHARIGGFGELGDVSHEKVKNMLHLCLDQGWLQIADQVMGTFSLSRHGSDFLVRPGDFWISPRELKTASQEKGLFIALQQLRRDISRREGLPPFRIFTDFLIRELVEKRPASIAELRQIPGFDGGLADRYGEEVIMQIRKLSVRMASDARERMHNRAAQPAAQAVKTLFLAGENLDAIARARNVKASTVCRTLELLHLTGHIRLLPWIEQTLSPAHLQAGTKLFSTQPQMRLLEAASLLHLTICHTRLCRLYAHSSVPVPGSQAGAQPEAHVPPQSMASSFSPP